ncbi:MAG TPA: lantibiotic dehydratase [Candidatus Angelobacter sp.]
MSALLSANSKKDNGPNIMTAQYAPNAVFTASPAVRETPEHCVNLPDPQWAVWKLVCLRSAGFAADNVLKLAATKDLVVSADAVTDSQQSVAAAQEKIVFAISNALDTLRATGQWSDKEKRSALLRVLAKAKAGSLSESQASALDSSAIHEFCESKKQLQELEQSFQQKYSQAVLQTTSMIKEIADSPLFREAVAWQNRRALSTALNPLLHISNAGGRPSHQRQHEELVASYLQRYSTKNDSIGFFGPVAWANFTEQDAPVLLNPGRELLAARSVHFEAWTVDALASTISKDRSIFPYLAPVLDPAVRVEGFVLFHPQGVTRMHPRIIAALNECTGKANAKNISAILMRSGHFSHESQVYDVLVSLVKQGIVHWGLHVPLGPHPEQFLRAALEEIEPPLPRNRAMEAFNRLESARLAVAASAGNAERVAEAMENLEQVFIQLTNTSPTRKAGETTAGRTLVYEDCRRDCEVLLGTEILRELGKPLSLLLHSSRWLTSRFAEIYRKEFLELHSQVMRQTGERVVDAMRLFRGALSLMVNGKSERIALVKREFQEKWKRALNNASTSGQSRQLHYSVDQIREAVMAEFQCEQPGWAGAIHHTPDVMLAAGSVEEVCRGNYLFVLGELHVGGNTVAIPLFANHHPSPDDLRRHMEKDVRTRCAYPAPRKNDDHVTNRFHPRIVPPSSFWIEYTHDSYIADRSKSLPLSSLVVENCDGELIARTRDARLRFKVLDTFSNYFFGEIGEAFQMVDSMPHMARICMDRLVVRRETWQFSASTMTFVSEKNAAIRFLKARQWAHSYSMPRLVFFKIPGEKPCYLDFESPILVDFFSRMVRNAIKADGSEMTVEISEMLPRPDETWLCDAQGRRYTSEFRIVAVDLAEHCSAAADEDLCCS